ncbi:MAG: biotin-dependent carboxyltransferase family protein [Candidatus Eremiobacteraeota bacterium]|nr:biotin-dependent carboxyltransferase family protein [Candidatus Eremiobacteraeota bacterium]
MKRTVEVVRGGLFSTVQDQGRQNVAAFGVSPAGAADWYSACAANRLVFADLDAPLIETTLDGITFVTDGAMEVAVTGAVADLSINASPAEPWRTLPLRAGDRVQVHPATSGVRSYVAFGGGLEADVVMGSASTDVSAGFGGHQGRALRAGDILALRQTDADAPLRQVPPDDRPAWSAQQTLRVLPGPHLRRLGPSGAALAQGEAAFRVTPHANRQGIRLAGGRIAPYGWDAVSFGVCAGCVQVDHDGQPIILLCDHQTTGGYGVAWVVIRADLPLAAQLRPGELVALHPVTQAQAASALEERLRACERIGSPT